MSVIEIRTPDFKNVAAYIAMNVINFQVLSGSEYSMYNSNLVLQN